MQADSIEVTRHHRRLAAEFQAVGVPPGTGDKDDRIAGDRLPEVKTGDFGYRRGDAAGDQQGEGQRRQPECRLPKHGEYSTKGAERQLSARDWALEVA